MLTKRDLAKYPFTKKAISYVEDLSIKLDDLANKEFKEIVIRAKKRIEDAVRYIESSEYEWKNDDIELLSFSTSLAILSSIKDERVKNRYALAESKKAYKNFKKENNFTKILMMAENTFNWSVKKSNQVIGMPYDYKLSFHNYLRNSVKIIDSKWKLTNRIISQGYVYVTRDEICRLLQEEVRSLILDKIWRGGSKINCLQWAVNDVEKSILPMIIDSYSKEHTFKGIKEEAFPPCVKNLYEILKTGGNLSHIGRFTLTSFLINIGIDEQELLKLFKKVMDFDEKKTIYQIEHIAGVRGSKTKYSPPKCETLKTHGICLNPDKICLEIRKPIDYYIKKMRRLSKKRS